MGRQPNLPIGEAERPVARLGRAPEKRWTPHRPGEIELPADFPTSGPFGKPGPDTGWALRLIAKSEFERGNRPGALDELLVAMVGARASANGRAPVKVDVNVALSILGLRNMDLEAATVEYLVSKREAWLDAVAHEWRKGASALADIPHELLMDTPVRIRARLNAQPSLVG